MSEELDLGTTHEAKPMPETAMSQEEKSKKCYPQFSIRDKAYDDFKKKFGAQDVNDELTATVRLRVCGVRSDEYSRSMELEVKAIIGDSIEEEEGDDDSKEGHTEEKKSKGDSPIAKRKAALKY